MLDKFNTSTFAQETTSITGSKIVTRQYSPRVAILGHHTFSGEGHAPEDRVVKISDEPANTVNKQVVRINETIHEGFDLLNSFRQEADVLRADTDSLMTMLMERVEEVLIDVQPEIYADYKKLKADIKE